jgi:5-formyltetrahydrofolate cyclo-ligase
MPKRTLRQQMLAQRRALSSGQWQANSLLAQQRLLGLDEYLRSECIALYAPLQHEVDTALLGERAFGEGKRVLYPLVCGHEMVFKQVEGSHELVPGSFGILEPRTVGSDHSADEADLIVVPGVVFDRSGHRIGFGKGYYDRFLRMPDLKACLVGFCHDFQVTDDLIRADQHDIRMDIIVTESRIIRC